VRLHRGIAIHQSRDLGTGWRVSFYHPIVLVSLAMEGQRWQRSNLAPVAAIDDSERDDEIPSPFERLVSVGE
jgi:hypothetical protein